MGRQIVKKIGILVLMFSLALFGIRSDVYGDESIASAPNWKEVYAHSGDCRIAFPSIPQMMQQHLKLDEQGKRLTYDLYLAPYRDSAICLLLIAHYPSPIKRGSELAGLEGLLKGIIAHHPENQLVFAEVSEFLGVPSVSFLIQSGKNYFRGQAFMAGSKLYLIAMEGKKQQFEESIFLHFSKTFKLVVP